MYKTNTIYDGPFFIKTTVEDKIYGLVVGNNIVCELENKKER